MAKGEISVKVRPNRIKEWISKRSLNQSEVARQLGISTSYLSLITNGKRNPNLRLSTKLANLLDADLLDLFPQPQQMTVSEGTLDLVFCYGLRQEMEKLHESIKEEKLKVLEAHGDFEAGYYVARHRPHILLLDTQSIGHSLTSLVNRLKDEPMTVHTRVVCLVDENTGKRRRRQIDKMGLEICEWASDRASHVISCIKDLLSNKVKSHSIA
jgi:transcriptional regulator with XRE-family HTH domain